MLVCCCVIRLGDIGVEVVLKLGRRLYRVALPRKRPIGRNSGLGEAPSEPGRAFLPRLGRSPTRSSALSAFCAGAHPYRADGPF
jgi:hypothetical protein